MSNVMDGHNRHLQQRLKAAQARVAELYSAMDEASDTAGKFYQMVGRLQGPECSLAMDMLVDLSGQLETASNRKARHDTGE